MDSVKKWDSVAADYQRVYGLGKSEYSAQLMGFLLEEGLLRPGCRVLDIGCGVGKYGTYMAELGCDVTLTDISPEMLRRAGENMAPFKSPWRTLLGDFSAFSGDEEELKGGFDLVMSTMCPAVHDLETVKKMSGLGEGWCFLSRFISWEQPERDRLMKSLGLQPRAMMDNMEEDCRKLTAAVSAAGYRPRIKYADYSWQDRRSPQGFAGYVSRRLYPEAEDGFVEKLRRGAEAMAGPDGLITDRVDTKVIWIYWNAEKGEKNHDTREL